MKKGAIDRMQPTISAVSMAMMIQWSGERVSRA